MDMTQTGYVKKVCSDNECDKEVESHLFFDSTLCKEHAYDDEVNRDPKELECSGE